ncbi:MAG: hypothetical protein JWO85_2286 [Candidatus Eremiobacteraeota bacterium]|jgi:hypothetical protein|nr:hypothetical protein [Candidatus Eremiobacteraeota bacterium]
MRTAAFVAVLLLFACAFVEPAQGAAYDIAGQRAASARLDVAWQRLATGRPREAYRTFRAERAYWEDFSQQSLGYVDAARGMMIAAIFARDDARDDAAWQVISGRGTDATQPGDTLVFAGRWNDAFRVYRDATQDLAMTDPRAPLPDRVVAAGVSRALRGDFHGAIVAWSAPAVGGGPYDLTDMQVALIGLARARLGDWSGAEEAWLHAARIRRNIPQLAEFETGNLTALAMLRHFRAHFARGEGQYRWRSVPSQ